MNNKVGLIADHITSTCMCDARIMHAPVMCAPMQGTGEGSGIMSYDIGRIFQKLSCRIIPRDRRFLPRLPPDLPHDPFSPRCFPPNPVLVPVNPVNPVLRGNRSCGSRRQRSRPTLFAFAFHAELQRRGVGIQTIRAKGVRMREYRRGQFPLHFPLELSSFFSSYACRGRCDCRRRVCQSVVCCRVAKVVRRVQGAIWHLDHCGAWNDVNDIISIGRSFFLVFFAGGLSGTRSIARSIIPWSLASLAVVVVVVSFQWGQQYGFGRLFRFRMWE
mmetsp:Transcript_10128/g.21350  ORF Transcript_10128/g.21350 Transcript_10128/m.21350 type:complete len:273 (-) Transcript_10128:7-825(-)